MMGLKCFFGIVVFIHVITAGELTNISSHSVDPTTTSVISIETTTNDKSHSPASHEQNTTRKPRARRKTSPKPANKTQPPTDFQHVSSSHATTSPSHEDGNSTLSTQPLREIEKNQTKSGKLKDSRTKNANHSSHGHSHDKSQTIETPSTYKSFVHRITTPRLIDSLQSSSINTSHSSVKEQTKATELAKKKATKKAPFFSSAEDDSDHDDDDDYAVDSDEDEEYDESGTSSEDEDGDTTKKPKKPKKSRKEKKRMLKKEKRREMRKKLLERGLRDNSTSYERERLEKLKRKEERTQAWFAQNNKTESPGKPKRKQIPEELLDDPASLRKYLDDAAYKDSKGGDKKSRGRGERSKEDDDRNRRGSRGRNDRDDRPSYGGGRRNDRYESSNYRGGNDRGYDRNDRYRESRFGRDSYRNDRGDRYGRNDRDRFDRRDDRNDRYRNDNRGDRYRNDDRGDRYRNNDRGDRYRNDDRNDRYRSSGRQWDDRRGSGRSSGYGRDNDRHDRYRDSSFRRDDRGRGGDRERKYDGKGYGKDRDDQRNQDSRPPREKNMKKLEDEEAEVGRKRLVESFKGQTLGYNSEEKN